MTTVLGRHNSSSVRLESLSFFGRQTMSLAEETMGIRTQDGLADFLTVRGGRTIHPPALSKWLRGERQPPQWLACSLIRELGLDEEQIKRLSVAFSLGWRKKPKDTATLSLGVWDLLERLLPARNRVG